MTSRFFKVKFAYEGYEIEGLDPGATETEQKEAILSILKPDDLAIDEVTEEEFPRDD